LASSDFDLLAAVLRVLHGEKALDREDRKVLAKFAKKNRIETADSSHPSTSLRAS
jgi:hypothetical protein